ncbi:hypothetical protein CGA83_03660 [Salmonella enterica subsp. enterica serovar Mbandaka]|jgi:hypothetical protein|uniref:Uncharacterized protein n=1 Tax=Salmonella enterica subsp. enterica serovar Mbandaka TaxID=192954 RepID=A0A5X7EJZ2_SALET|nr:hypothetical protein [Salmonella enterica subsp. enterica serovar Mbandaka]EGR4424407.1 hypothetical protein [Vibrio cholerae]EKH9209871.1 hypothetical protein [Vibrio parahaemolyticus]NBN84332.1 hypothetical protein [Proteus sp. G2300]PCO27810.1 hypothetical protein CP987_11205 [Morganella morganii]BDQ67298.1 hypothetical protein NUITMVS2_31100 [Shewanella xiamenensis]
MAAEIQVNGLVLPINDAHIHQRRGVTAARAESGEPLHFTVLKCLDGRYTKTYCGLARVDNTDDFLKIMEWGDHFEPIASWYQRGTQ